MSVAVAGERLGLFIAATHGVCCVLKVLGLLEATVVSIENVYVGSELRIFCWSLFVLEF